MQLLGGQVLDHGQPGSFELPRGRRGSAPGHAIGLLDERDDDAVGHGDLRHRDQISRLDTAACAVPEDERGPGTLDRMDVRPRRTMRGLDLEDGHAGATSPRERGGRA